MFNGKILHSEWEKNNLAKKYNSIINYIHVLMYGK